MLELLVSQRNCDNDLKTIILKKEHFWGFNINMYWEYTKKFIQFLESIFTIILWSRVSLFLHFTTEKLKIRKLKYHSVNEQQSAPDQKCSILYTLRVIDRMQGLLQPSTSPVLNIIQAFGWYSTVSKMI